MTSSETPHPTLYRRDPGAEQERLVCALELPAFDPAGAAGLEMRWGARAQALLQEIRNAARQADDDRGRELPYASLRAAIQIAVPNAQGIERDLGAPWRTGEGRPAVLLRTTTDDSAALLTRVQSAVRLWIDTRLHAWAEKLEIDPDLVDALSDDIAADSAFVFRDAQSVDASATRDPRQALAPLTAAISERLVGQELFAGLGPVRRVIPSRAGGPSANVVELETWPRTHDGHPWSMVAEISVTTLPGLDRPVARVRATRRRWSPRVPEGRTLRANGYRNLGLRVMTAADTALSVDTSLPLDREGVPLDSLDPPMLQQLLACETNLPDDAAGMVSLTAEGAHDVFVGCKYATAFARERGLSHKVGFGASTRDQIDLLDTVRTHLADLGARPLEHAALTGTPRRAPAFHKQIEVAHLLAHYNATMATSPTETADAETLAQILSDDLGGRAIDAPDPAKFARASEQLSQLRDANIARIRAAHVNRPPVVTCVARTQAERNLMFNAIGALFGDAVRLGPGHTLPAQAHGPRAEIDPDSRTSAGTRFQTRYAAWKTLADAVKAHDDPPVTHALVQAPDWFDRKPDDAVSKPAGRAALAREADVNAQWLRPIEAWPRGNPAADYLYRLQNAVYDLLLGHAGAVDPPVDAVAQAFPREAERPRRIIGIGLVATGRTRGRGVAGEIGLATSLDPSEGRCWARAHPGAGEPIERWSPLAEFLKRVAGNDTPDMGDNRDQKIAAFQRMVKDVIQEAVDQGQNPLVIVDADHGRSLWPFLQNGDGTPGDISFPALEDGEVDPVAWRNVRIARVDTKAAGRILKRKTRTFRPLNPQDGWRAGAPDGARVDTATQEIVRLADWSGGGCYWASAGYRMQVRRGLSVWRDVRSFKTVVSAKRPENAPDGALFTCEDSGNALADSSYLLPSAIEIAVLKSAPDDTVDRIARLVDDLRQGYGHHSGVTALPAPLAFERKLRDYIGRFALPDADETDPDRDPDPDPGPDRDPGRGSAIPGGRVERILFNTTSLTPTSSRYPHGQPGDGARMKSTLSFSRTESAYAKTVPATPAVDTPEPADLGDLHRPLISLPSFADEAWVQKGLKVVASRLRCVTEQRDELARLSGFADWPETTPNPEKALPIILDGLRYPLFARAYCRLSFREVSNKRPQKVRVFTDLSGHGYRLFQEAGLDRNKHPTAADAPAVYTALALDLGKPEFAAHFAFASALVHDADATTHAKLAELVNKRRDEFLPADAEAILSACRSLQGIPFAWQDDIVQMKNSAAWIPLATQTATDDPARETDAAGKSGASEGATPALTTKSGDPEAAPLGDTVDDNTHNAGAAAPAGPARPEDAGDSAESLRAAWTRACADLKASLDRSAEPDADTIYALDQVRPLLADLLARWNRLPPETVGIADLIDRLRAPLEGLREVLDAEQAKELAATQAALDTTPEAAPPEARNQLAARVGEVEQAMGAVEHAHTELNDARARLASASMSQLADLLQEANAALTALSERADMALQALAAARASLPEGSAPEASASEESAPEAATAAEVTQPPEPDPDDDGEGLADLDAEVDEPEPAETPERDAPGDTSMTEGATEPEPALTDTYDDVAPDDENPTGGMAALQDPDVADIERINDRLNRLFAAGEFGTAYHLRTAAEDYYPEETLAFSRPELLLNATAGMAIGASHAETRQDVDALAGALSVVQDAGRMESCETTTGLARRIALLAAIIEPALYRGTTTSAIDLASALTANGAGHYFYELEQAALRNRNLGSPLTPSRLYGASSSDMSAYAKDLGQRLQQRIATFREGRKGYKAGEQVKHYLCSRHHPVGELDDAVSHGDIDTARDFGRTYQDRGAVDGLLSQAEEDTEAPRIVDPGREKFISHITEIANLAETWADARAVADGRERVDRITELANVIRQAAEAALGRLDPLRAEGGSLAAAANLAIAVVTRLRDVADGKARPHTNPERRLASLHAPLLWVPGLHYSGGWVPEPYDADLILETLRDNPPTPQPDRYTSPAFEEAVRARKNAGSFVAARLMLRAGWHAGVPEADLESLSAELDQDAQTFRSNIDARVERLRRDIFRAKRYVIGEDQTLSLLEQRLEEIHTDRLPVEAETTSISASGENHLLDFAAAEARLNEVNARLRDTIRDDQEALRQRLAEIECPNDMDEQDFATLKSEISNLIEQGDLAEADERLSHSVDSLSSAFVTPDHFKRYFRELDVPGKMEKAPADLSEIRMAIETGERPYGLDFDRIEEPGEAIEVLDRWSEFRRTAGSDAYDSNRVLTQATSMLQAMGLECGAPEVDTTRSRGKTRRHVANVPLQIRGGGDDLILPDFGSETQDVWRLAVFQRMPTKTDVKAVCQGAEHIGVIILVPGAATKHQREQLGRELFGAELKALVIDESLFLYTLAQPRFRAHTLIEVAQAFSAADPYEDKNNLPVPPEMFVGREREWETLKATDRGYLVYGGRRLGKTALLRQVAAVDHRPDDGIICTFISLHQAEVRAIWELASSTDEMRPVFKSTVKTGKAFAEHVRSYLEQDARRRILLLVDEANDFIKQDADQGFQEFRQLQSLMTATNSRFKVVLAGLQNIARIVHTHENAPVTHLDGGVLRIGPLMQNKEDLRDAERLVTKPLAGLGFEFERREDVWRILSFCNYYPVLIQLFGKHLIRKLADRVQTTGRFDKNIDSELVEEVLFDANTTAEIRETFFKTLRLDHHRYEFIAYLIAQHVLEQEEQNMSASGLTPREVRQRAETYWPAAFSQRQVSDADIAALLDEMQGLGVLRNTTTDHWTLRSRTVLTMLQQQDVTDKLLGFLDAEAPRFFEPRVKRRPLDNDPKATRRAPITTGQEYDLLSNHGAGVRIVLGTGLADIGDVPEALITAANESETAGLKASVSRASTPRELQTEINKVAKSGTHAILIVPANRGWTLEWRQRALANKAVRQGQAHVVMVGGSRHAATIARVKKDLPDTDIVTLLPWRPSLTDAILRHHHVDLQLATRIHAQTGGWNLAMNRVLPNDTLTDHKVRQNLKSVLEHLDTEADTLSGLELRPGDGLPVDLVAVLAELTRNVQTAEGDVRFQAEDLDIALEVCGGSGDTTAHQVLAYLKLLGLVEEAPSPRRGVDAVYLLNSRVVIEVDQVDREAA
jgi:hypothetical protein